MAGTRSPTSRITGNFHTNHEIGEISALCLQTHANKHLADQIGEEGAHHIGAHNLHDEVIEIGSDDGGCCVIHECLPSFIVVNRSHALCRSECVKKDGSDHSGEKFALVISPI